MRIAETTTIERPIGEAFAYLAAVERHPEWVSAVLATQQTSDGPVGLGATFTEETKILGRRLQVDWEITAYEPPHTIQQRATRGPARLVVTVRLEATRGATQLTVVQEGESGSLLTLADALVARSLKKQAAADLEALRTLVESGVAAASA
jgi:uncharacterized protein YndB with AHSA1/START domain